MEEQLADLLAGEDVRQLVMVFGFDLGKDLPVIVPEHLDEEEAGRGGGLADGLGLPVLDVFDVEDVVAEL